MFRVTGQGAVAGGRYKDGKAGYFVGKTAGGRLRSREGRSPEQAEQTFPSGAKGTNETERGEAAPTKFPG